MIPVPQLGLFFPFKRTETNLFFLTQNNYSKYQQLVDKNSEKKFNARGY